MAKRAQLTIFITIGVVILILVGIILYLRSTGREAAVAPAERETLQFPTELKPVGLFVQTCLEKTAEDTINKTAIQGGRPLAPKHPYVWENMTLSHGYYMGINDLPTLEEMQDEMDAYLQIHIEDCLNGLQSFKDRGMDLQIGQLQPGFKVGMDVVVVDLSYPITLQGKTGTQTIEKFNAVIPSRLGYLHDAAYKIVQEDVNTGEKASFAFISQFDISLDFYSFDDFVSVFRIYDSKIPYDEAGQSFFFADDYKRNHAPSLEYLGNIIAYPGELTSFYVNATDQDGGNLTFSDDSSFFDIDSNTGLVQFTPAKTGSEIVTIKVTDTKESSSEETFRLDVLEEPLGIGEVA